MIFFKKTLKNNPSFPLIHNTAFFSCFLTLSHVDPCPSKPIADLD